MKKVDSVYPSVGIAREGIPMDLIAEYRLYATALYLNLQEEHDKNAEHCRTKMLLLAELGDLSLDETNKLEEAAAAEVEHTLKILKPEKFLHE